MNHPVLPDVASTQHASQPHPIKWVGMEKIALPLIITSQSHEPMSVSSQANVFVSLDDPKAKGIHMSRLYLKLYEHLANQPLSLELLKTLLSELVESQKGISRAARVDLAFDLMIAKKALLSEQIGYATYPIKLSISQVSSGVNLSAELQITYSSTCPCSASLSRQLYKEAVEERFNSQTIDKQALLDWLVSEQGTVATPHSQRSFAYLQLDFSKGYFPDLQALLEHLEQVITTPVQTAVKREDEQAFAKLNAENLMFCEDAARKLKTALESFNFIRDYWFKIEHQESLHAHNAVAIDYKNHS
ncbi:GTP cyclohydrolase FolE2 [Celerinatantimonas sp. MCCC 1A17872]|uniref:GTP cyclohydrolase FolE2 n=1 Tax=Celerinatantimonas sp. MCCC 1A17872 TaxID=3177514 RepID=UPI0038BFDFAB